MKPSVDFSIRRAGIAVPLSALGSEGGFGIGDTASLERFFGWMSQAGLSVLQLLPLKDLGPGDSCPYAGLSAMAFDALAVIDPCRVPELRGRTAIEDGLRRSAPLRRARRVDFEKTRTLKRALLEEAFRRFERSGPPERREEFGRFCGSNSGWLDEYALFRSLKEESGWRPWAEWEEGLRERRSQDLAAAHARLNGLIRFHEWLQWTVHEQWSLVRKTAAEHGILLFGDIPFGISRESSDVWAGRDDFDLSANMGAPPDKYSEVGQDWGLPAYRWDRMEEGGHAWWRRRLHKAGELYDLYRLDHAIGFFRTWQVRGDGGRNRFDTHSDAQSRERGRRFFAMAKEAGAPAAPVAEDLGLVPEFMPPVMSDLSIPGYRIAPWMMRPDGTMEDPARYPACSVATLANHDMPPFARWWREAPRHERDAYWKMASGRHEPAPPLRSEALRTVLANLYASNSALVLIQIQDAFGSRDRINVPGTVNSRNWTYRVPYSVEALLRDPRPKATADFLRSLSLSTRRL
ncbi:MAG: 4-alpha-glucanotransferase [Elusimicrobia bacterium]|nr:4-alpha-glucanotransferase [Elusimicrobiota bacterium]